MPRAKSAVIKKHRHNKILKQAKGYFGSRHALVRTAHEQVMKSLRYQFRDRKQKKRQFRKLWITRINAACKLNDISYSRFITGLRREKIEINRKMLSEIAISDPKAFTEIVLQAKKGLKKELPEKFKDIAKELPDLVVAEKTDKKAKKEEKKPLKKETVKKPEVKKEVASKASQTVKKEAPKTTAKKSETVAVKKTPAKDSKEKPVAKKAPAKK